MYVARKDDAAVPGLRAKAALVSDDAPPVPAILVFGAVVFGLLATFDAVRALSVLGGHETFDGSTWNATILYSLGWILVILLVGCAATHAAFAHAAWTGKEGGHRTGIYAALLSMITVGFSLLTSADYGQGVGRFTLAVIAALLLGSPPAKQLFGKGNYSAV